MHITVSLCRINTTGSKVDPRIRVSANSTRLLRSQDHITQALIYQQRQRRIISRSFRKPQRFGIATETVTKIGETPNNLRQPVAIIAAGQNCVAIGLRNSISMAATFGGTFSVRSQDALVGLRVMAFEP